MTQSIDDVPFTVQAVGALAESALRGDIILKEELGVTDGQMEAMYAVAYHQLQEGQLDGAIKTFSVLSMLNPKEYKYVLGIASCFHAKGEHELAGMYYIIASGLGDADPVPFLHAAECMLAKNDVESASNALRLTIELAGKKPQYAPMRKRAEIMLEEIHG